ncbi:hypothetical protein Patl1_07398 [Pistacia atlantica]|uniref:Uncharacterized protein n=1 Tax=Pistacia atlantica TaxID=434234 RepID=A0ACC1AHA0_9ROSI|nr:hypothetical protein Patl1_07398 [Pistacia atlantica]
MGATQTKHHTCNRIATFVAYTTIDEPNGKSDYYSNRPNSNEETDGCSDARAS